MVLVNLCGKAARHLFVGVKVPTRLGGHVHVS